MQPAPAGHSRAGAHAEAPEELPPATDDEPTATDDEPPATLLPVPPWDEPPAKEPEPATLEDPPPPDAPDDEDADAAELEAVEPDDDDAAELEPEAVEPDDVEPDDVEPDDVEPDDVEPLSSSSSPLSVLVQAARPDASISAERGRERERNREKRLEERTIMVTILWSASRAAHRNPTAKRPRPTRLPPTHEPAATAHAGVTGPVFPLDPEGARWVGGRGRSPGFRIVPAWAAFPEHGSSGHCVPRQVPGHSGGNRAGFITGFPSPLVPPSTPWNSAPGVRPPRPGGERPRAHVAWVFRPAFRRLQVGSRSVNPLAHR